VIALTVKEIAEICDGRIDGADADATVTSVVTDSRAAAPGSLFFALPGESLDGHTFADGAIAGGAVAAVIRKDATELRAAIRVGDPLAAMGALATYVRGRLRATTIAITGSSGKTGTDRKSVV